MVQVPRHMLPHPGTVIVLNGASSAGKTSIAKALQAQLGTPFQHVQLDAFRAMEPVGYWDAREQWAPGVLDVRLAALCRAMHATVAEFSRHGQGVIFDTVLDKCDVWHYLLEDLAHCPVYLVGVVCSVEVLSRRELTRGDRKPGLAARQAPFVHADKEYDFQVDTTDCSADQCADEIAQWLASGDRAPTRCKLWPRIHHPPPQDHA